MKQQVPEEFQKWHSIFRSREKQLPDNVKNQLLFIASKLFDQHFDTSRLSAQNTAEIQELSHSGKRALLIMFKTLIKAFLHQKQKIETLCKVKFTGFFEFWKDVKVVVSDQKMSFCYQHFVTKYDLKQVTIVNCRASKKCFDLVFKGKTIAFVKCLTLQAYNDLVQLIQSKIDKFKEADLKNRNSIKNLINSSNQFQLQKVIPENVSTEEEIIFKSNNQSPKKKQHRDHKEATNFMELLKGQRPEGFQITHQTQNMFIFASKTESKIHVSMVLNSHLQLEKVVNFYLQQKQWNSFVVSEKINQIEENLFQIFRIFRKESLFQYERAVISKISVFCTKNTANLTEQSEKIQKKEGKLNCAIKSNVKFVRMMGGIKINIDCSLDGKGYYESKDSSMLLQKIYSDIKFFQNSIKISQLQNTKLKMLIITTKKMNLLSDKQPYLKDFRFQNENLPQDKQGHKLKRSIGNLDTNDSLDLVPRNQKKYLKANQFTRLRPLKPDTNLSIEYIRLVSHHQYQNNYLKERFDQSIMNTYDDHIPPYCLSQLLSKKQYKVSKNKELVFIDYQLIKGQKNSLLFVIRQVGANLISGKSVLNVSLPVDIFQSRSLLQRSAACFGMAPDYLIPVANSDPLTQIKSVVTLFSHIPTLELVMLKPFNPILGQTFQAYIKGIPIYYQQISHHPPISSFYMTCPEFTMYGNLVAFADVSLNSAVGGNQGITYIKMRNGSQFQCYFPPCEISGLIVGSRTFRAYGRGYILEKNHNILAQISIEKDKKDLYEKGDQKLYPGDLIGGIFKIDPKTMQILAKQPSLKKFQGIQKKNVEQKLANIRGTWFDQIKIDNEVMNKGKKIYPLEYAKVTLPSDSNYRLDVLYHKLKDIPQSQCEKQILQTRQRGDRKLREKHAKMLRKQQK